VLTLTATTTTIVCVGLDFEQLALNDRSVTVNKESSVALGQGFRYVHTLLFYIIQEVGRSHPMQDLFGLSFLRWVAYRLGFLGTLHMDVFRQRLADEYASEVIITRPFVPLQRAYYPRTNFFYPHVFWGECFLSCSREDQTKYIMKPPMDQKLFLVVCG
jgi:hypothetical protein